jgi:dTDP-glucose pyrophosphorylase
MNNQNTHLIVPLMGNSNRFKSVNIKDPKWSLPLNGKPAIFYALDTFSKIKDVSITIILPYRYKNKVQDYIKEGVIPNCLVTFVCNSLVI